MGIFDAFRRPTTQDVLLATEVATYKTQVADLEFQIEEASHLMDIDSLRREDAGWQKIGELGKELLTHEARVRAANLCRAMTVLNPLLGRGLTVRTGYIHGQGVEITAAVPEDGGQDVNTVIQEFMDDPFNQRAWFGPQARAANETRLFTDGNVYAALLTNPANGAVQVRTIDPREISDKYTNPDDALDVWFYKRGYTRQVIDDTTGQVRDVDITEWHPALGHNPSRKLAAIGGHQVRWDAPLLHVHVNDVDGWGIGDGYAAMPYAKSYKEFLEDWSLLTKSLSRIAWKISGRKSASQAARHALEQLGGAGNVAAMDPTTQLEAVPKTGATIDAESGRPLAAFVASALGIPVTTLLADPGQTGARAVAETLDKPTILEMGMRRSVWTEADRIILEHVIDASILAPRGALTGQETVDAFGRRQVVFTDGTEKTITHEWPSITDTEPDVLMKAISDADATGKMPPVVTMRLMLTALGVKDVDEIIDAATDENGNWIDPAVTAGDAAVDAFNRGEDPAEALRR